MNILLKQHEILLVLNNYRKDFELSKGKMDEGLPWNDLAKKVNLTSDQLWYVATRLADEKDIEGTDRQPQRGYYITNPKGIASLGTKKYVKERTKILVENSKNIIQILVPVLALSLSILIYVKSNAKEVKLENEIKILKEDIRQLKVIIDSSKR